jgi:hypothetical protein
MKTTVAVSEIVGKVKKQKKSKILYADCLPDGIVVGFKDNTIVVGTKKEKESPSINEGLMGIAKQKLWDLEETNDLYISDWCKTENDKHIRLYNEIKNMMPTEDLKGQLLKFDTVAGDYSAAFGESQFIQGYLEGYKFAKQMLENKKERTVATGVFR